MGAGTLSHASLLLRSKAIVALVCVPARGAVGQRYPARTSRPKAMRGAVKQTAAGNVSSGAKKKRAGPRRL